MHVLDSVKRLCPRLTNLIAKSRWHSDFVCGECERWERCGRPPSDDCIVRAEQIARNRWGAIRRRYFLPY